MFHNCKKYWTCPEQSASFQSHFANFKPLICYHASHNPHQYHRAQDYGNFCHLGPEQTGFLNICSTELRRSINTYCKNKTNHTQSTYEKMLLTCSD